MIAVPLTTNLVNRTMPPRLGAEIAFCMVLRWLNENRLPDSRTKDAAIVMTPSPPTWIRARMMICPNSDQWVAVSCTISPVTQTAEVEVNSV